MEFLELLGDQPVFHIPPSVNEEVHLPDHLDTEVNRRLARAYARVSPYINNALIIVNDAHERGEYVQTVAAISTLPSMPDILFRLRIGSRYVGKLLSLAGDQPFLIPPAHLVAINFLGVQWPGVQIAAPAEEIAAPAEEIAIAAPAEEIAIAAPAEEIAAPAEEIAIAAPAEEIAAPAEEIAIAAPAEEIAAPAEEIAIAAPAEEIAAPAV